MREQHYPHSVMRCLPFLEGISKSTEGRMDKIRVGCVFMEHSRSFSVLLAKDPTGITLHSPLAPMSWKPFRICVSLFSGVPLCTRNLYLTGCSTGSIGPSKAPKLIKWHSLIFFFKTYLCNVSSHLTCSLHVSHARTKPPPDKTPSDKTPSIHNSL